MAAQVDPAAGLIRVGDRSWPFDLDLRSGSATIEVDGRRLVVRPLSWQEKLRLARYAHLGGDFVERQLVRLCLMESATPEGLDGTAERAVAAASRWMNEPDPATPAQPLDVAALGRVAVEVCRAAGLKPADLAGRDAAEVEELYRAVSVRPEPAMPPVPEQDGFSRIVIVPDPSDAAPSPVAAETGFREARATPAEYGAAGFSSVGRTDGAAEPGDSHRAAGGGQGQGAAQPSGGAAGPGEAGGPAAGAAPEPRPAVRVSDRTERRAVRRFRVSGGPSAAELPLLARASLDAELDGSWASAGEALAQAGLMVTRAATYGAAGRDSAAARTAQEGRTPQDGQLAREARTAHRPSGDVPGATTVDRRTSLPGAYPAVPGPMQVLAPMPNAPSERPPSNLPHPPAGTETPAGPEAPRRAWAYGADERDELFEELCERLEQAATEMGVDVGGW